MPAPINGFKLGLTAGRPQIGLWLGLASSYSADLAAGAGFDWLLIDGEHAPNDLRTILAQLQAVEGSRSHAVVRAPVGEDWVLKQLLDIGAQTILVPMVDSADQAERLVRAVRYPPHGIRGVGAALARASRFNRIPDYLETADGQICLLVQVETVAGLAAIEDIAAIDGVDGIFVGPSDLAADMGFLGQPGCPEVVAAVERAIGRIVRAGKPAGILTPDTALADRYLALGAGFVAVGSDVGLLAKASRALAERFKTVPDGQAATAASGY